MNTYLKKSYWISKSVGILFLCSSSFIQGQVASNSDGSYTIATSLTGGLTQGGFGGMLSVDYKINTYDFLQANLQANFFEINSDMEISIPVRSYALNLGFFYDVLRNNNRTFALAVGAGVSAGYEAVDEGENSGVDFVLGVSDTFVYGGYVGIAMDVFIIPTLALTLNGNEFYHINSEIGKWSPYGGLGVKLILL